MNITLQINAEVGKLGTTGEIAQHVGLACLEKGMLAEILCLNKRHSKVPGNYVKAVFPFLRELTILANVISKYSRSTISLYHYRAELFDYAASRRLNSTDIYHTWNLGKRSLREAKKLNATTVWELEMNVWEGEGFESVDYIFAPSKHLVEKAIGLGMQSERVFYHPFGVDTAFFTPRSIHSDTRRYIFVGALNSRKGIRELLMAWKRAKLENAELVLCGRKHPYFKKMMNSIQPQNVRVLGFLSREQLRDELRKSYAFVFPSKLEGSAKATYEALACGLPVITTREAGSVVTDGKDGFIVEQSDIEQMSEAMQELSRVRSLRDKMSFEARATAKRYTWEHYKTRTLEYYDVMTKTTPGKPSPAVFDSVR